MQDTQTSEKQPSGKINFGKVDPKLLEILACPLTKTVLRYDEAAGELISDKAKLAFPVRDGIPIMLVEEARPLDEG
ncbi:Trm112 family protein [Paremcibacter congregatus]|uniref:Trm112 family protein n=1 Tax=Paremcibacter congregatus TaxID=2043170 RepID=UPI0030EDA4EC|tara:strand:- start:842 stop:1069 length:228 start_codon:yes stop_codon:yes gene_type:complete